MGASERGGRPHGRRRGAPRRHHARALAVPPVLALRSEEPDLSRDVLAALEDDLEMVIPTDAALDLLSVMPAFL
ncbi:MAG: hypothetical protein WC969_06355 [Elusimicrobiota bacterium]|jgi:hypothetical protein